MKWDKIKAKDSQLNAAAKASKDLAPPEIPLDKISTKDQVRKKFHNMEELSEDIKARGLLQPITVVKGDEPGTFIVLVGERRFRAAKLAGLKTIPAFVRPSQNEFNRISDQLAENIQREKLAPLEIARSLNEMKVINDLSNRQLAEVVNKDLKYVGSHLALLRGPDSVQSLLEDGLLNDVDAADNLIKIFGFDESVGQKFVDRYRNEDSPSRKEIRGELKRLKSEKSAPDNTEKSNEQGKVENKEGDGHAHQKSVNPFVATEKDASAWKPRPPDKAEIRVKVSVKGTIFEGRLLIDRADEDDGKVWVLSDDDTELRVPLKSLSIMSVK